jgi:uncharacterized protein (TIGR04255 family)
MPAKRSTAFSMTLPKKITPDSIKEAFVEFRYATTYPFEIMPGIWFEAFDNSYSYTEKPIKGQTLQPQNQGTRELKIQIGSQSFIYNENIIIQVLPNSFVFSCLNRYIGWSKYRAEIEKALTIIMGKPIISHWTRVGIRYISEYPKKDLRECAKFDYSFGHPDINSRFVMFRSEFEYKNSKIILNLNNLVPVVVADEKGSPSETPTSVIDIDVIKDNLQLSGSVEEMLNLIDDSHILEKELFFSILQEQFLAKLNPEY